MSALGTATQPWSMFAPSKVMAQFCTTDVLSRHGCSPRSRGQSRSVALLPALLPFQPLEVAQGCRLAECRIPGCNGATGGSQQSKRRQQPQGQAPDVPCCARGAAIGQKAGCNGRAAQCEERRCNEQPQVPRALPQQ